MNRFLRKIFVGFFVIFLVGFGQIPSLEARDDWEYWNAFELKKALHEQWDIKLKQETRFQDDFGNFYLTAFVVMPTWKPNKFLEIGSAYRYEYAETAAGKNTDENRFFLETLLKASAKKLKLSNRFRPTRKDVSGRDFWSFRNQIKVSYPLRVGGGEMSPFVSDELFWDPKQDKFNQNRLILGISRPLTRQTTLDLFYLLRSDRTGSDWSERHVLGTEFKVSF